MYTLLSQIYTRYCGYPEYNLAILGLQQTGKTQLYRALKDQTSPYMVGLKQQYKPTLGLNTKQIKKKQFSFLVWDLGGKSSFRKIWQNYYPFCHGAIFLFDNRIGEGFECLQSILNHNDMSKIPLLVFVRSSEFYSQIKERLDQLQNKSMKQRAIFIELLPHSRQRLYEHLKQIYKEIIKLDQAIRE